MPKTLTVPPLIREVTKGGKRGLEYSFHPGQRKAWASTARVVAVIAGTRAGKTSWGACWLHREIWNVGPGDYLVAAPSYPLLDKGVIPEVESLFERILQLGKLKRSPFKFEFSEAACLRLWGKVPDRQPRIIFGHADDPDSLEAMTAKAAWLDEAGQRRFRLASYEAVQRRLSIDQGRTLITTTPYDLSWLKQQIFDPWDAARKHGQKHPEIEVIQFDSTENPAFPRAEWERAQRTLPGWKFSLYFRAQFARPAGLIYGSFDEKRHVCPRFKIPERWPRYVGMDFGATNTAAIFLAEELNPSTDAPTGTLYVYREYHPGEKLEPEAHVRDVLKGEPRIPTCVGGNPQEQEWRQKFAAAGLPVLPPPIKDVEVGIDTVFALFARMPTQVVIFDDLCKTLDQLASYSRELDDQGEPTEKIDSKASYHILDSFRYVTAWLRRDSIQTWDSTPDPAARSEVDRIPKDVWDTGESGDSIIVGEW